MKCIVCQASMKKEAMFGVLVDFCQSCKGVWLDKNEFTRIVAMDQKTTKTELVARMKEEESREALKVVSYRGLCQRCGSPVSSCDFHGVHVDKCKTCGGMFFEQSELTKCMSNCKKAGWLEKLFNLMR